MSNPTGLVPNPLLPFEMNFIRVNHSDMPVKDMAKALNRSNKTIYQFMDDNDLAVYRKKKASVRAINKNPAEGMFIWDGAFI